MADNPDQNGHPPVHTPQQIPRAAETAAAPWSSFLPTQTHSSLFSSLAESGFGPSPTADYEKKVIDEPAQWSPLTPAGEPLPAAVQPSSVQPLQPLPSAAPTSWQALLAGLPRPEPRQPDASAPIIAASTSPRASRSESPIDVVNTSAFAQYDQSPVKEEAAPAPTEIVRPQPLRFDSLDAASNPLLILASESSQQQQQQPPITLASIVGMTPDTVMMSAEPGPSSGSEQSNASPPSKGCYTRAPGLGPPSETPTSGNGQSTYVCAVCGFSCASKFHYNSHMNTHGDHQCTMCDYTSRTEGRLKKHMRESHTAEQQRAAGLDVSPPPATPAASAAAAATAASSANSSPLKDSSSSNDEEMTGAGEATIEPMTPGGPIIPTTLSSMLFGMIPTSSSSSMTSALEQMRAITEQPLMGSNDGLLLAGTPLEGLLPMREEGATGGSGGGGRRKAKTYKCKQCSYVSVTKEDSWAHARTHIPSDKQMSCDKCGFVTEYKHHLEYHQRNHAGIKPFQCKKCAYTCVNKSMLNSHMKSHSNVYQFRCADCNYATKYCHSLKLHLKKYAHRRNTEGLTEAELLNSMSAESSPPSIRKDSTASISSSHSGPFTPFGPFTPSLFRREEPTTPVATPTMPSFNLQSMTTSNGGHNLVSQLQQYLRQHQLNQMLQQQAAPQEDMMRHNISDLLSNGNLYQALGVQASLGIPDRSGDDDEHHTTTGSPSGDDAVSHSNGSAGSPLGSGRGSSDEGEGGSSRRKSSKPSRMSIDVLGQHLLDKASPDATEQPKVEIKQEEAMDTTDESAGATADVTASSAELVLPAPQPLHPQPQQHQLQQQLLQLSQPGGLLAAMGAAQQVAAGGDVGMMALRQAYLTHLNNMSRSMPSEMFNHVCRYCTIGYADKTVYGMHMSFHSPENPMQCTRCGMLCANSLHFNLHLLQNQHL